MLQALWSGGAGILAQQANIDLIANNLSNINTTGFKKSRADFADLLYSFVKTPGYNGGNVGSGVRLAGTTLDPGNGAFGNTGRNMDLAIEGEGYFQIRLPGGELAYTRDGSLYVNADRQIITKDGNLLEPAISVPDGATDIMISKEGEISVRLEGQANETVIGRISLTRFVNPGGLEKQGANIFLASEATGLPETGYPGNNGFGVLNAGSLEMSNVNLAEEMVNLIMAQRAYEFSSKAVKNADEMMNVANGILRR